MILDSMVQNNNLLVSERIHVDLYMTIYRQSISLINCEEVCEIFEVYLQNTKDYIEIITAECIDLAIRHICDDSNINLPARVFTFLSK